MKNTFLFVLFISAIVALYAFAFSFSQDQNPDGKQIFMDNKCNSCHTVSSQDITSKKDNAMDLSNAASTGDAQPKMSEAQKRAIYNLSRRRGISVEDLEQMAMDAYGSYIENLNSKDASSFIRNLQQAA